METTRTLRDSARVTLDASGNGQVRLGPGRPNTRWLIKRISVTTSTNTLEPEAKVYRGSVGDAAFVTGTFTGSSDTDPGVDEELHPGEQLIVRWTGGDVGATATATWYGDEITGAA